MMVKEKPSVFGDAIFELIDVDGSGGLEFSEFVVSFEFRARSIYSAVQCSAVQCSAENY